ncbi:MAG TPA: heme-degrading domain-containing protein [Opitutales bacterium]|nr:heme-degrading domain-containing protein [Opitutales bacterium]
MTPEQELVRIDKQEAQLRFDYFNAHTAWELGMIVKSLAESKAVALAIEIRIGENLLFYYAMPGTTPDNANWIRRKSNLVSHFQCSSYKTTLKFEQANTQMEQKFGLSYLDYMPAGGSFPIVVTNTGCVGALTVSGSTGRQDHCLVVEALTTYLHKNQEDLALD